MNGRLCQVAAYHQGKVTHLQKCNYWLEAATSILLDLTKVHDQIAEKKNTREYLSKNNRLTFSGGLSRQASMAIMAATVSNFLILAIIML